MIGCGIPIIASVLLCSLCAVVGNALPKQPDTSQPVASVVTQTPTPEPTTDPSLLATILADTPTPSPTPVPTVAPVPTQAPVQQQPVQQSQPQQSAPPPASQPAPASGVNGNPWGYDFNPGNYIYSPVSNFCSAGYFCDTRH
jgi:hypothetical protein